MEIKGKVHCFFEQSGTFKNEFIKLGIPAEDYDIQNNFGQTDHTDDLFKAIEDAYDGKPSLFDRITPDDLIMAFFPCIKFCNIAEYNQKHKQDQMRKQGVSIDRIYEYLEKEAKERHFFYLVALHMHAVVEMRGLRMIMENPWNEINYTNHFWFKDPSVIDKDRTLRGDLMKKPTAYWYTNCEPTFGMTIQITPQEKRMVCGAGSSNTAEKRRIERERGRSVGKGSNNSGICSEERSMISPDYARNFICDFILGKEQKNTQLQLF
jgi:hypothetical protein